MTAELIQLSQRPQPGENLAGALVDQPYSPPGGEQHFPSSDSTQAGGESVRFAWLELTARCQEECGHCYAESGPTGTHGSMTTDDWGRAIDQLAERGTNMVQFIGGEPTLHPELIPLIGHVLTRGMNVEVYSNLVHVTPDHWEAFQQPGVSLATSYYSPDPSKHREITRSNTLSPIRRNIRRAGELEIPLRVGLIGVEAGQDIEGAIADLQSLGVDRGRIGVDYLRQVGRGVRDAVTPETVSQLCGNCADGVVAIMPDGRVQPCVFSRQSDFTIGNVREASLDTILDSRRFADVRGLLREEFYGSPEDGEEGIQNCTPDCTPKCTPSCDPSCSPRQGTCVPDCQPTRNPCVPDASQPCRPADCTPTCAPPHCRPEK